jgi:hypothetical protein
VQRTIEGFNPRHRSPTLKFSTTEFNAS